MLRKVNFSLLLKNIALACRDRVPKFGFSLMEEVDGREVKVLFMPTKHGLPGTNITIGGSNSSYLDVDSMIEN